jgi:hypothetical protein
VLIESIIRRNEGTRVEVSPGRVYHFRPDAQGRHVADVTNAQDAAHLLTITEGFRPVPVERPIPQKPNAARTR